MPMPRYLRWPLRLIGGFIAILILIYAVLVGAEAYSAWRLSRMLTRLEALRIDDDASAFRSALSACDFVEQDGFTTTCTIVAGPWHYQKPWEWLSAVLPQDLDDNLFYDLLPPLGLRAWYAVSLVDMPNDRIENVGFHMFGPSRYEMLGARWELARTMPPRHSDLNPGAPTYLGWYHITSLPSGEGFSIYLTPTSSKEELAARRLNTGCLLSFKGCNGLCELLPTATILLKKRGRGFGGCCGGIPAPPCDIDSECRKSFRSFSR